MIPKRGKALVDTDISMAVPAGTCMFIVPFAMVSLHVFYVGQDANFSSKMDVLLHVQV